MQEPARLLQHLFYLFLPLVLQHRRYDVTPFQTSQSNFGSEYPATATAKHLHV